MLDTTPNVSKGPMESTSYKKKLIEVALPLQAINAASAREKSIRHGHPSTLHLWWARRPLAACRAVLFASLVDDPSSDPERFPTVDDQEKERARLFGLIEELVQWDNSLNEGVLSRARSEIRRCVSDDLPPVYDPFCGGGAIPIEAQRLGLPTFASDLNPVAVLITKALTEIPWRFKGLAPVHPALRGPLSERTWERATGLAADVEAYGKEMVSEARRLLGKYYPPARLSGGQAATVIAWLWARTVRCANPVCGAQMPLIRSLVLCTRPNKEWHLKPIVDRGEKTVRFEPVPGKPDVGGTISRRGGQCLVCGESVSLAYIRDQGKAGLIGSQMLSIVALGERGRVYLPADEGHVTAAANATPTWSPDSDLVNNPRHMSPPLYGMTKHRDLFTSRQLLALTTLCDLVKQVHATVMKDARAVFANQDNESLELGGGGARAYADAVATYLAMAVNRLAPYGSNLSAWDSSRETLNQVFIRQSVSMVWDFAEGNPLSDSSGNFGGAVDWVQKTIRTASAGAPASVFCRDAATPIEMQPSVTVTDPPYYDNVPYADLSDFFYVWLRESLHDLYPESMATLLVPKQFELVADPARFNGDREASRKFFEDGLESAFREMFRTAIPGIPSAVFYAFKQTERGDHDNDTTHASIGWESMLGALLGAGFQITGTWPMTSEMPVRIRSMNSNALASSIVLVCRPRAQAAPKCSRVDFVRELRLELGVAVDRLRAASLAATDLQQAALGPGMAVFSKYSEVLESDDSVMTVRSVLSLISEELAHILLGDISDVDPETHFALAWFDEYAYQEGLYGKADVLLRSKNASLENLVRAGVLIADGGRVRLVPPQNVVPDEDDSFFSTYSAWAQTMHLLSKLMGRDGSEERAAAALRAISPVNADRIKAIAYHCYLLCDRTKRSTEARDFNALVAAWPDLQRLAAERGENMLL